MREVGLGETEAINALLRPLCQPAVDLHRKDGGQPAPGGRPSSGSPGTLDLPPPLLLPSSLSAVAVRHRAEQVPSRLPTEQQHAAAAGRLPGGGPSARAGRSGREQETAAVVAEAVGRMPPTQRAVVTMRVWNGLSYAEKSEGRRPEGQQRRSFRVSAFGVFSGLRISGFGFPSDFGPSDFGFEPWRGFTTAIDILRPAIPFLLLDREERPVYRESA